MVVWVIVAVIAVALAAAWIILRRRSTAEPGGAAEPAAVAAPRDLSQAEGPSQPDEAEADRPQAEVSAAGVEAAPTDRREEEVEVAAPAAADAEVEGETAAATETTPVEAAPEERAPELSPRSQVETQLDESARLLDELRDAASGAEEGSPVNAESVEIMEEGLQEIRALAERKQWDQARDKGRALHAQLTLLLQSARREKSS